MIESPINVTSKAELTANDFTTDQEVRWCPGCGDYAILKAVKKSLAEIGRPPHEVVFVSGIGCAARFPYYVKTYGFHTIHGRAPAIATGVKMANPSLDVWVVGGDGDMLSIGGNHLMHVLRRDIDLTILLFNNAIYGLTKGQYSPTSPVGTRSPTSPAGSEEKPANAALLALGSGATFVSRTADTMVAHLGEITRRAHQHKGTSLLEVLQNCIVYNDAVWGKLGSKSTREDASITLEHGMPMVFGKKRDKALVWDESAGEFAVIDGEPEEIVARACVFDEGNFARAVALARMDQDGFPMALGVLYCKPAQAELNSVAVSDKASLSVDRLQNIVNGSGSWEISE